MKILKFNLVLSLILLLGFSLTANPTPKKKLNKKQRLAKVFGFGKKTKNKSLAPVKQLQRAQPIKTAAQRKDLNRVAAKLPAKQRAALFAKNRQQKYAIQAKQKAANRAKANVKRQAPAANKIAGQKNVQSKPAAPKKGFGTAPGKVLPPGQQQGKIPAAPKAAAVAKGNPPPVAPRTNAPAKAIGTAPGKVLPPGQQQGKIPAAPKGAAVAKGTPPPVAPRANVPAKTAGAAAAKPIPKGKSIYGPLPNPKGPPPPVPPRTNLPGKSAGTAPGKVLPPGQKQSKIPSKSGVVYGKLPNATNQQTQKNTKGNVKAQLKEKANVNVNANKKKQPVVKPKRGRGGR